MNWVNPTRLITLCAVAAIAVGAPPLESIAKSKRPPAVQEAPPPPPTPPGPVGLPSRLLADAGAYSAYLERVTATSPASFTSGAAVSEALKTDAADDPDALIRGAVAYAAAAALQDSSFIAQIRAAGNSPENRQLMVGYIIRDPAYVFLFKGSDEAAGLAREALGSAGLRLLTAGKAVKQSAYEIQHQMWSKEEVADRPGRLAAVKASARAPMPPAEAREMELLQRVQSGAGSLGVTAAPAQPPYTTLVDRALQLAAIAALGEATDAAYDRLTVLTTDDSASTCLHIAKLNLYQCLAVAKPNYEDVFCLGQHVMADTGYCLAKNAGMAMPTEPPPPAAAPPEKVRGRHHAHAG